MQAAQLAERAFRDGSKFVFNNFFLCRDVLEKSSAWFSVVVVVVCVFFHALKFGCIDLCVLC